MKTNERRHPKWSAGAWTLALLALASGTALGAMPATTAYHFSSHPMIAGTVVVVNDHQMVVDTDQGERVTLEVDSRTMAPRDLAPGMVMRAEFLALEDCRLYAQRIMPIRGGMSLNRRQAYAQSTDRGESRLAVENGASAPRTTAERSPGPMMTATPTTADYQFSTRPLISGRALAVNDHRLVVETDQGRRVGLVMDSRTMVPGEVAPGTFLRVEFTPMKDGRYYAKRVSQDGSAIAEREQAYAHTRDSDLAVAENPPDCGFTSAAVPNTVTSAVVEPTPAAAAPVAERPETLPQTGSHQPSIALLGFLALGAAAALAGARRLGRA